MEFNITGISLVIFLGIFLSTCLREQSEHLDMFQHDLEHVQQLSEHDLDHVQHDLQTFGHVPT